MSKKRRVLCKCTKKCYVDQRIYDKGVFAYFPENKVNSHFRIVEDKEEQKEIKGTTGNPATIKEEF